ncbi:hypothetical protein AMS68_000309 [Peltaster fructicola]|uniref:Heterokaryon incompatibility domain-containing protein n=1 Tax=Peltaster fructicola TaxID=286661 RepID=A0A6H0XJ99_9PEZI|nr:hypothetical protein AMS68_000309 [Peltaster fructicola]
MAFSKEVRTRTASMATTETSSTDLSPFAYQELGPFNIRLVTIEAAEPILSLKLDHKVLEHFDNDPWQTTAPEGDAQGFIAVSYTWGDPSRQMSIQVNGGQHNIGLNCYEALIQLSKLYPRSQTFWIDALCINQNDITEKNIQVDIMAEIFRQAVRVTSMLGQHADDSDYLFEIIRQFHAKHILVGGNTPRLLLDLLKMNLSDHRRSESRAASFISPRGDTGPDSGLFKRT